MNSHSKLANLQFSAALLQFAAAEKEQKLQIVVDQNKLDIKSSFKKIEGWTVLNEASFIRFRRCRLLN